MCPARRRSCRCHRDGRMEKPLARTVSLYLSPSGAQGSLAKRADQIKESTPWLRGARRSLSRTRRLGDFARQQRSSRAFGRQACPRRCPPNCVVCATQNRPQHIPRRTCDVSVVFHAIMYVPRRKPSTHTTNKTLWTCALRRCPRKL